MDGGIEEIMEDKSMDGYMEGFTVRQLTEGFSEGLIGGWIDSSMIDDDGKLI